MVTKNWFRALAAQMIQSSGIEMVSTTNAKVTQGNGQGYSLDFGNDYYQCPSMYQPRFNTKLNSYGSIDNANGVYFGDGDTPPTVDDYTLSGNVLTTGSATVKVTKNFDNDGITITGLYTITNTGDTDFTIREVGLFLNQGYNRYLMERTVLDTPVTIPAGGIGQVTYTIRFNYPTA
jgi:hypothetical protein